MKKIIIKISFATILTELPVSLREKRNANEILICCLGFYVTAFVPRYRSHSSVKRVRGEGCRNRGEGETPAPGCRGGAWLQKDLLEPLDRQDGASFLDTRGSGSPAGDTLAGGKPFLFLSFFSLADRH